ncbi:DUF4148 domain-containing protein [Caballeronia sp. AZ10_KS36]|uniref:DUF4148 domain-containing protein n=1 Tax=Caballeronia sp. AZ10_KS36 TaxID=2921757 RepID=UPI002027CF98|nr:DUF4148 domain-containing protein [Caballeronia sp. AZ10_KS36]
MNRFSAVFLRFAGGLCIAVPVAAFAQTSTQQVPMTRARAQCELRELESVGYQPWQEDFYYPRNLQLAQARLAAKKRAQGLEGVDTCAGSDAAKTQ